MYGSAGRADCFSPRKALWCARRHILPPCGYADSPKGCRGRAESPLLASINDNFAVSNSPWRGLTRRYRREGRACSPMGRSIVRVAIRRGLGRAESPQCARRRNPQPPVGIDAPTPARIGTCRPKGRSHFSFGGERKVCKRKPAARRLREKALYCPFWRRGSLCRAQRSWPATPAIVRARSSPFSAVKMGGPFSLRCLSPLCSPAVGVGHTQPLQGFRFRRSGWRSDLPLAGGFRNAIGQAAGSHTRPASREACRRAAVASRSSCMSPERPARLRRAVRG